MFKRAISLGLLGCLLLAGVVEARSARPTLNLFLLDTSGSMLQTDPGGKASAAIKHLLETREFEGGDQRCLLILFSHKVQTFPRSGQPRRCEDIRRYLRHLPRPSGGTHMAKAFAMARKAMTRYRAKTRLFLLTDGAPASAAQSISLLRSLASLGRSLGFQFAALGLSRYHNGPFLNKLKQLTGGEYLWVDQAHHMFSKLDQLFERNDDIHILYRGVVAGGGRLWRSKRFLIPKFATATRVMVAPRQGGYLAGDLEIRLRGPGGRVIGEGPGRNHLNPTTTIPHSHPQRQLAFVSGILDANASGHWRVEVRSRSGRAIPGLMILIEARTSYRLKLGIAPKRPFYRYGSELRFAPYLSDGQRAIAIQKASGTCFAPGARSYTMQPHGKGLKYEVAAIKGTHRCVIRVRFGERFTAAKSVRFEVRAKGALKLVATPKVLDLGTFLQNLERSRQGKSNIHTFKICASADEEGVKVPSSLPVELLFAPTPVHTSGKGALPPGWFRLRGGRVDKDGAARGVLRKGCGEFSVELVLPEQLASKPRPGRYEGLLELRTERAPSPLQIKLIFTFNPPPIRCTSTSVSRWWGSKTATRYRLSCKVATPRQWPATLSYPAFLLMGKARKKAFRVKVRLLGKEGQNTQIQTQPKEGKPVEEISGLKLGQKGLQFRVELAPLLEDDRLLLAGKLIGKLQLRVGYGGEFVHEVPLELPRVFGREVVKKIGWGLLIALLILAFLGAFRASMLGKYNPGKVLLQLRPEELGILHISGGVQGRISAREVVLPIKELGRGSLLRIVRDGEAFFVESLDEEGRVELAGQELVCGERVPLQSRELLLIRYGAKGKKSLSLRLKYTRRRVSLQLKKSPIRENIWRHIWRTTTRCVAVLALIQLLLPALFLERVLNGMFSDITSFTELLDRATQLIGSMF